MLKPKNSFGVVILPAAGVWALTEGATSAAASSIARRTVRTVTRMTVPGGLRQASLSTAKVGRYPSTGALLAVRSCVGYRWAVYVILSEAPCHPERSSCHPERSEGSA